VNSADASNSYKLSIRVNTVEVASVALAVGTTKNQTGVLASAVAAGDIVCAFMVKTGGPGGASSFNDMAAVVEITA
jgi:hypothetical protein